MRENEFSMGQARQACVCWNAQIKKVWRGNCKGTTETGWAYAQKDREILTKELYDR